MLPSTPAIPARLSMPLQLAVAICVAAAVSLVWVADAQACSPIIPAPHCEYTDVNTEQLPECFDLQPNEDRLEDNGYCDVRLEAENNCNDVVELRFYCDEQLERFCSEDRTLSPRESTEIFTGQIENDELEGLDDQRSETLIGVEVTVHSEDDEGDQTDDNNGDGANNDSDGADNGDNSEDPDAEPDPNASFEVQAEYNDEEVIDGCPRHSTMFGCAASSPSAPLPAIVVVAIFLVLFALRRNGDDTAPENR